jgi:hypothetical protein
VHARWSAADTASGPLAAASWCDDHDDDVVVPTSSSARWCDHRRLSSEAPGLLDAAGAAVSPEKRQASWQEDAAAAQKSPVKRGS